MKFLEQDLENIIFNTDNDKLWDRGLHISGKKFRQFRIGNYGIADLITVEKEIPPFGDSYLNITIYELKKENIDISAYLQAIRYAKGIQHYLKKRNFYKFNLYINLVGSVINLGSDIIYLNSLLPGEDIYDANSSLRYISSYTYSYDFDGLSFERHDGYQLRNNGFNI